MNKGNCSQLGSEGSSWEKSPCATSDLISHLSAQIPAWLVAFHDGRRSLESDSPAVPLCIASPCKQNVSVSAASP